MIYYIYVYINYATFTKTHVTDPIYNLPLLQVINFKGREKQMECAFTPYLFRPIF